MTTDKLKYYFDLYKTKKDFEENTGVSGDLKYSSVEAARKDVDKLLKENYAVALVDLKEQEEVFFESRSSPGPQHKIIYFDPDDYAKKSDGEAIATKEWYFDDIKSALDYRKELAKLWEVEIDDILIFTAGHPEVKYTITYQDPEQPGGYMKTWEFEDWDDAVEFRKELAEKQGEDKPEAITIQVGKSAYDPGVPGGHKMGATESHGWCAYCGKELPPYDQWKYVLCPECEGNNENPGKYKYEYTTDELPSEFEVILPLDKGGKMLTGEEIAKKYLELKGGQIYTQVDTEGGVMYQKGWHIVNRTGVYAIAPGNNENQGDLGYGDDPKPFFIVGFPTQKREDENVEADDNEQPEELREMYATAEEAITVARNVVAAGKMYSCSVWRRDTGKHIEFIPHNKEYKRDGRKSKKGSKCKKEISHIKDAIGQLDIAYSYIDKPEMLKQELEKIKSHIYAAEKDGTLDAKWTKIINGKIDDALIEVAKSIPKSTPFKLSARGRTKMSTVKNTLYNISLDKFAECTKR